MPENPQATTPPLTFSGVRQLKVLCLVAPATLPDRGALERTLCDNVREIAARGAPFPVSLSSFGDPTVMEPDTATLLVHATVDAAGDERLIAFHIRHFRIGPPDTQMLFGAAPRIVRLPAGASDGRILKTALAQTLAETLPWIQQQD